MNAQARGPVRSQGIRNLCAVSDGYLSRSRRAKGIFVTKFFGYVAGHVATTTMPVIFGRIEILAELAATFAVVNGALAWHVIALMGSRHF
jgi:hypothetical protein